MKVKKRSYEDRKSQILDAARFCFAKKGFTATTLDDIALRVGISRPRVIQIFGSKLKIYEAIATTAYRDHPLDKDLSEPIQRGDDFAVFQTFAYHILNHTVNRKEREVFKILMEGRLREDRFHRVHFDQQDALMISRLLGYVTRRVADGIFKKIDPRTIVYAYQAMISNLVIYKNVLGKMDFVGIEELSRNCTEIFLNGILTQRPMRPSPRSQNRFAKNARAFG